MLRDQSPIAGRAGEAIKQFQASSTFQAGMSPPARAGSEEMPAGDVDAISLAMRQFYQSPANATG